MNNAILIWLLSISVGANFGFAMAFYNTFVRKPEIHVHELKLEDLAKDDIIDFVKHQNAEIKTAIKKAIWEE